MKILLDTNIVLDLLMQRELFYEDAVEIFTAIELGKLDGYLCATTITTIYYLVSKNTTNKKTDEIIENLLQLFKIADVDKEVLLLSLKNNGVDFEDSVIYTSAKMSQVDMIISRDKKGFKNSKVEVKTPKEFLVSL
jgi:predicted nucleic acid-binding protein